MSGLRGALGRAAQAAVDRLPEERREPARRRLRRLARPAFLGTIRRTEPLSRRWGYDRGQPVDRYYIDGFLREHRADIRGRVLEVKESLYTDRYGTGVSENVLTAIAFLGGMAAEELKPRELDHRDEWFPVVVAVRAVTGA